MHFQKFKESVLRQGQRSVQSVWPFSQSVTPLINADLLGKAKNKIRVFLKNFETSCKVFRPEGIVMGGPVKIFPSGHSEDLVVVPGCTYVFRISDVTNPGVGFSIFTADFLHAIRRCIVRNDQLEIRERLGKNGVESIPYEFLPIVNRHTHGNYRHNPLFAKCGQDDIVMART